MPVAASEMRSMDVSLKSWENVASENAKGAWHNRAALAALFLRAGDVVCDLGAGSQPLKQYLPEGVGYLAVDCVDTLPGTHLADFNTPDFTLPAAHFNVLTALGVLNWLNDSEQFLERLSYLAEGKFIIFTYDLWHSAEGGAKATRIRGLNRLRLAWKRFHAMSGTSAPHSPSGGVSSLLARSTAAAASRKGSVSLAPSYILSVCGLRSIYF